MKKLLILAVLMAISCSEDDLPPDYTITLRDRCLHTPFTEYTTYEVDETTFNEVIDATYESCGTCTFTDISGNEVSGIYAEAKMRPQPRR